MRDNLVGREQEVLEALAQAGSQRGAAKALGVSHSSVQRTLARIARHANEGTHATLATDCSRSIREQAENGELGFEPVLPGYVIKETTATYDGDGNLERQSVKQHKAPGPEFKVPDGHIIKGLSAYVDSDGRQRAGWVKTDLKAEAALKALKAAADALREDLPRERPTPAPARMASAEHLLNQFTVTDLHFGMLSWRDETGADYDLAIAEKLLLDWFAAAIELAPPAHTAVLAQLGDLLHHDGHDSVTPTHRHVLDADSRLQKVIRCCIRTMRRIVSMLLEKHQHVHVIMADANHDPASGAWLRETFADRYEDEPRVTVDTSAKTYYAYEWGLTSLFYHHGHKRKIGNVDSVFAGSWREVYGRTRFSYAHLGHLHSDELKSTNLMKVERHETLAAPDAYAANGGWLSGRSAKVITYSKSHGEVFRSTLSAEMVADWRQAA